MGGLRSIRPSKPNSSYTMQPFSFFIFIFIFISGYPEYASKGILYTLLYSGFYRDYSEKSPYSYILVPLKMLLGQNLPHNFSFRYHLIVTIDFFYILRYSISVPINRHNFPSLITLFTFRQNI